jgi:alanyl-tRNA synthetase
VKTKGKEQFQLVFNQTPFYAESGGQVGDTGVIENIHERIHILDTQKENNLLIHLADRLPERPDAGFVAKVDAGKRKLTTSNHSATHLLHAALREVLGTHVEQKGSLVNAEYLRFDFSHFKAMSAEELQQVAQLVNAKIRENIVLEERRNVPIEEAKKLGAMALFGEKYGDSVRVITFDPKYSIELCGGTHVAATGAIGLLKITSESAVAAGVRRIEAITSKGVEQYIQEQEATLEGVRELVKSKDILKAVQVLTDERAELLKRIDMLEGEKTQEIKQELKIHVKAQNGFNIIAAKVNIPSAEQLKNLSFQLRNEIENLYCVLGAEIGGKPLLSVIISDSLVTEKNLHAGQIIKEAAKNIQGGGGGQPFYATAGGNLLDGLDRAIAEASSKVN